MTNINTDRYEMKREIETFSNLLGQGVSKPYQKIILDFQYGLAKGQSPLLTDIGRSLNESISLGHTVDRLSRNLINFDEIALNKITDNFHNHIESYLGETPVVLLDDTDIAKPYGKNFEDLARIRDGSEPSNFKIKPGYDVCEAVALTKNQTHPISLYTQIYSTQSDGFKSKNTYTIESVETARSILKRPAIYVADRGYDANWFFNIFLKGDTEDVFITRISSKRNLLFKGKSRNVRSVAHRRKGKIRMDMQFSNRDDYIQTYLSHTRVQHPHYPKQVLYLIFVYGLSETEPMILLTNQTLDSKKDVIQIVRHYMSRWRVEEYFRFKKETMGFEKMRVRSLKAMNVLNQMMTYHLGMIALISERLNERLLGIKILERSRSINKNPVLWFYQVARGIKNILAGCMVGIRTQKRIEIRKPFKQMALLL